MKHYLRIIFFSLVLVSLTKSAHAVPPPDFIFNVGAQIIQVFSIAVLFLTAILASVRQYARVYFDGMNHKKLFWIGTGLVIVVVAFGGAYYYGQYTQDAEYKKWLTDSQNNTESFAVKNSPLDTLKDDGTSDVVDDKGNAVIDQQPSFLQNNTPKENKYIAFIREYYGNIGHGKVEDAYNVSKKSVSLSTFKSWYAKVTEVSVDDVQPIDDKKYSLKLTLKEGKDITKYAVLMTIGEDASGNLIVQNSQVRTLPNVDGVVAQGVKDETVISVSNQEFQSAIQVNASTYVLDAREDEEYEIGRFPGSNHIRFADLVAGRWIDVPTDKTVFVFCWSGMRGKDVAEFLRTKGIKARYIEKGASDWVEWGGKWDGGIKFTSKYGNDNYVRIFSTDETKKNVNNGVALVDSRDPEKFAKSHIPGAVNIPMIYTPTSKVENALAQVPPGKSIITICDDFISCFDAKVTGIKLEKKGHAFLGRYNKPWEY